MDWDTSDPRVVGFLRKQAAGGFADASAERRAESELDRLYPKVTSREQWATGGFGSGRSRTDDPRFAETGGIDWREQPEGFIDESHLIAHLRGYTGHGDERYRGLLDRPSYPGAEMMGQPVPQIPMRRSGLGGLAIGGQEKVEPMRGLGGLLQSIEGDETLGDDTREVMRQAIGQQRWAQLLELGLDLETASSMLGQEITLRNGQVTMIDEGDLELLAGVLNPESVVRESERPHGLEGIGWVGGGR